MNKEIDCRKNKWILRVFCASFTLLTLAALVGVTSIVMAVADKTDVIHIDKDFDGLSEFLTGSEEKTMRLLVIHGIGRHCIGYSDNLTRGIASKMGLRVPDRAYDELVRQLNRAREAAMEREVETQGDGENKLDAIWKLERDDRAWVFLNDRCKPITGFPNYTSKLRAKLYDERQDKLIAELEARLRDELSDDQREELQEELESANARGGRDRVDYNYKESAAKSTCNHIRKAWEQNPREDGMNCEEIQMTFDWSKVGPPGDEDEDGMKSFTMGYIRTQGYFKPDDDKRQNPVLKVYELVWDPATSWAKNWYTGHDAEFNKDREWMNEELKIGVVNESISDAVMYLGSYRELIQYPVLVAFCKVATDYPAREGVFECPLSQEAVRDIGAREFSARNEIAIVTHSLGTRIVFDALGILGQDGFFQSTIEKLQAAGAVLTRYEDSSESADFLRDLFAASLDKVFALANQVPLLELSELRHPFDFGGGASTRRLGRGFDQFLDTRKSEARRGPELDEDPLQVVAFTDPNDLLSYNLKCWYYLHVLRNKESTRAQLKEYLDKGGLNGRRMFYSKMFGEGCVPNGKLWKKKYNDLWSTETSISITDVSMSLAGLKFPGLYADPEAAHSKYFNANEDEIVQLIACGGNSSEDRHRECVGEAPP